MAQKSIRWTLNTAEWKVWGRNTLIFLAPVILVFLGELVKAVPKDWQYGALVLYLLNIGIDLFRKWFQGVKK